MTEEEKKIAVEPRTMKKLYAEIMAHPRYKDLSDGMRFAFEGGCVAGGSQCVKANNRWCREIWRHLYLGAPLP